MQIPFYQIDAFTSKRFAGNPAGVCPLEEWLDDETMQLIAAENNLSETAFFVRRDSDFELRWFTPEVEVDLCGHATLASAYVLFSELGYDKTEIRFNTKSGALSVKKEFDLLSLDFPSREGKVVTPPEGLADSLGVEPLEVLLSRDLLVVCRSEDDVRSLKPIFSGLSRIRALGIIATAEGTHSDFVSRFFAPRVGVDEDPATGSAHCTLVPYWSRKLGKKALHGLQVSSRGGEFFCEDLGDRVKIAGRAVKYLHGTIEI